MEYLIFLIAASEVVRFSGRIRINDWTSLTKSEDQSGLKVRLVAVISSKAVAGVVLEVTWPTPHYTLSTTAQHGPGLTVQAPPGLAAHTVRGTVNTQPALLPGARGTPGDTL